MAEVASVDPAAAETVIMDNEEDESKVRGARLQCVPPPSFKCSRLLLAYYDHPSRKSFS